ncbi:MAG TPA: cupin-like domain-containing protein [Steroidobacteraceae bacterium]|nr:cupin-like domain-containing protein [Steroidobacteraceae bacterium]
MNAQILVRQGVDLKTFRAEILPAAQPVVLAGLVKDWPAVRAGLESPRTLGTYLRGFDRGKQVAVLEGPPAIRGHFFYRDDMRGMNFERRPATIAATIERLLTQFDDPNPPALYIESTPTAEHLPPFAAENVNPLPPPGVGPRIWIGNTLVVQTHFDLSSNIACVVGGRRRFTLFPPAQLPNLYVGPIEFTISGPPISMVNLKNPDLARFPRFAEALAASQSAELEPGDALFIPYGWWHQVESLTPFNVLVNYWWNEARQSGSPFDAMLHAILALRDLPPEQRAVWHTMFEHYVFTPGDESLAHLPREQRGMLGPPSPERAQAIRNALARTFGRP